MGTAKKTFLLILLLVLFAFSARAEEAPPAATLQEISAVSMAAYQDRLLVLNADGLYQMGENGLFRLGGSYIPTGMETLPLRWQKGCPFHSARTIFPSLPAPPSTAFAFPVRGNCTP